MTPRPLFFTLTAALALTTALPAAAQDAARDAFVLDDITLTANREPTELSRSGSSVSVLTGEDLQGRAGQPLARSLTKLPGVTLRQSGPQGGTGFLEVRGAPARYVPVVIDGIEVSDSTAPTPSYNIGGQITAGIGRVELLRGAQSALYGSRAIAGILTLESLRPTENGLHHHFGIEAGSYNTLTTSYGATLRRDDTDLAFQLSHVRTDGFSALDENDGNFEEDGYEATRLSFYSAHRLENGVTIGFNGFWEDSTADIDYSSDATGTPGDDYSENESYGLRGFAQFSTGTVDHDIALTRYRISRDSYYNGIPTRYTGARTKLSWQGATDLAPGVRAVFGADTEKEEAEGNGDARLTGAFVETTATLGDRIDITTSLRRDDHSRFGGFTSGRVAAVYRTDGDLLFRAALGNGFRAPSLYQLFDPFYGTATLKPEESRTYELGIEKHWGDSHLRATAFWLKVDNLIGFDNNDTPLDYNDDFYNQVDGFARRRGIEIDGRYAFGAGHALTASYTFIDNQTDAPDWARVPERVLNLGAETTFPTGTTAGIDLQHVAGRADGMDDFTTVDLLVSHPVRDNATAYLRLENALDEDYQWVDGYGTSGRAIYAGLRASF
ncbi:TonB-dependent receptor plug domain-containing protein [Paracoccus everestensis]|uniref:TonB-dependent receptor plug domain-containing protein n=1 Tax=Paracoccus everestensis TaxID=2903900 RepID=UPI001F1E1532|nr:TonB-dependent receptor [Paracoccus everestensis]